MIEIILPLWILEKCGWYTTLPQQKQQYRYIKSNLATKYEKKKPAGDFKCTISPSQDR